MSDMAGVIVPKSDQWNADDFSVGPINFKIVGVKIKGGQEQPVSIAVEGSDKVYRPCKSMSRVLVAAWGADANKYVGRSLTLYCDPSVKWGGMAVGGIRISHMSDIDSAITMALTMTRANKKPYTVKPLAAGATKAAPTANTVTGALPAQSDSPQSEAAHISVDESIALDDRCKENNIKVPVVKKHFGVESFEKLTPAQLVEAHQMIDTTLAQRTEPK